MMSLKSNIMFLLEKMNLKNFLTQHTHAVSIIFSTLPLPLPTFIFYSVHKFNCFNCTAREIDANTLVKDGIGNFAKSFSGLTHCQANSQLLSEVISDFVKHQIVNFAGLLLKNLGNARVQQVCQTSDGSKLIKLGALPITYKPIKEFLIKDMEIGVKVVNNNANNNIGAQVNKQFILLQGRVSNTTHFISVETVLHRMGSTIIQNHKSKVNLNSVNGKPVHFYNYKKLSLDKMKIVISGKIVRITDQSTKIWNDDGSEITNINSDIVLDEHKIFYTFDTQSSVQIRKMLKVFNMQRRNDNLKRYIRRNVPRKIRETIANSSTITKVYIIYFYQYIMLQNTCHI